MSSSYPFWTTPFGAFRYAFVWLLHGGMRVLAWLPFERQLAVSARLGRAAHHVLRKRRWVAERNIELCLPELTPDERKALVRRHFESLGQSLAETATGWFASPEKIRGRFDVRGTEHLKAALSNGRGVILFSAHFTPLELHITALKPYCPLFAGMYKPQRNPMMTRLMLRGRRRVLDELFAKDNVRGMMRNLARNAVVWYASDQSYGHKGSSLVPFFNEPAMTNTAICRIAKRSGAIVLPCFYRRLPDEARYVVDIGAPLERFPSDDPAADVARLTRLLEDYIRLCPEQYFWVHQRFKSRPAPYPDVYNPVQRPA